MTKEQKRLDIKDLDLSSYDHILVMFSGGKDSTACFLYLLDLGVPLDKIELHHHCIDGHEGSILMDWPCTPDYCKKFADHFGLRHYYESWREGGFEREMLRSNTPTARVKFEDTDYNIVECGGKGPVGTRLKFPQVSPDLSVRWCSSYLKIDVCSAAINNQKRFIGKKTLVVTGERAEESKGRASYFEYEIHRNNAKKRTVHQWRPVHKWSEQQVWDIIKKYNILVHPAYRLGWGRLSCITCIFGSANQFASVDAIDPKRIQAIATYEKKFGVTIKRKESIPDLIKRGQAYLNMDPKLVTIGLSKIYKEPIITNNWTLPPGAFGESAGPT